MTPKEKAEELLMKYQNIEALKDFGGMDFEIAKQCAIIAVKEVLFTVTSLMYLTAYYQEVLTELEQL